MTIPSLSKSFVINGRSPVYIRTWRWVFWPHLKWPIFPPCLAPKHTVPPALRLSISAVWDAMDKIIDSLYLGEWVNKADSTITYIACTLSVYLASPLQKMGQPSAEWILLTYFLSQHGMSRTRKICSWKSSELNSRTSQMRYEFWSAAFIVI